MDEIILGVLQAYSIPPDFGQRLHTVYFWGYPLNIPYPIKTEKTYVPEIFWDIPGIFHIPKKQRKLMYQLFFGISLVYPISRKLTRVVCTVFILGYTHIPFFLTYVLRVHKV